MQVHIAMRALVTDEMDIASPDIADELRRSIA